MVRTHVPCRVVLTLLRQSESPTPSPHPSLPHFSLQAVWSGAHLLAIKAPVHEQSLVSSYSIPAYSGRIVRLLCMDYSNRYWCCAGGLKAGVSDTAMTVGGARGGAAGTQAARAAL